MCAVADASAYICNGETDKTAEAIAQATASAYAKAVTVASATCEVQGNASVHVAAVSSAEAAAKVWLEAWAHAWAGAGDCEKCDAYADSEVYVQEEVFLKAVSQAEVHVCISHFFSAHA